MPPTRSFNMSRPTGSDNNVSIDRARRMAWESVQHTDANQKLGAFADPTHSHWIHKFDLGNNYRLVFGRIVDEIAYAQCYKVQLENGNTAIWCTSATATALQPIGARQLGQISIGAGVIVALHPADIHGIIISVIPDYQVSGQSALPDFISQQARCGLLVDSAHNYPLTLTNASRIGDWSAGRPFDATGEGEFGHITETGLLDFIDSFMTAKRVDEECGIWHFWHDQLTRIAGHNLQFWTAGYEREDLDDEGEFSIVESVTPYYWEALGALQFDTDVTREYGAQDWQKDPDFQAYSAIEPVEDTQVPFYRFQRFYGYLGQGFKHILSLPPITCAGPQAEINTLEDQNLYPGVFEENLGLTGRYSLRSAHEIILSKHINIPTPKRIVKAEDPQGDNSTNYKAASNQGLGDDHLIVGEVEVTGSDDSSAVRAAAFLDTHAFVFNWANNHQFHYHALDWYLPNEDELLCGPQSFQPPEFDRLYCEHTIPAPTAIPLYVDHRHGEVNYYPNHSYFGLLQDGGIVLGDGFGSEIRMVNGHIYITTPGDIVMQSGRNVINMAGYDFIARAKNSWDITATNKDGRLKVNRNLMAVAAGDCGGILLESMATTINCDFDGLEGEDVTLSGIMLKAPDSIVSTNAAQIGMKLSADSADNVFVIDAGWNGRIKLKGQYIERFISSTGAGLDFFVSPSGCEGTVQNGAEWRVDGTLLPNKLIVNDKLLVNSCAVFRENVVVLDGNFASGDAEVTIGKIGTLTADTISAYTTLLNTFDTRATALITIGNTELTNLCDRQDTLICDDATFTYRTVAQYRTSNYVLFESRWQQLARLASIETNIWTEDPINDTYPYPGKEILLGNTFRTIDLQLYDVTDGLAVDRGSVYETPSYDTPTASTLNTTYTVII